MSFIFSKIILGTAQLGMVYGIANKNNEINETNSKKILEIAVKNGINCFDSSTQYGNSEKILGEISQNFKKKPISIICKIPKIKLKQNSSFDEIYYEVKKQIVNSCKNLKMNKMPIVLLHDPKDITNYNGLVVKSLIKLQTEGLIEKIGVSTYSPEDITEFLRIDEFDVIQIPINIFDLRLIKNGLLDELKMQKKIIFARSVFLQGLLFMQPNELPRKLKNAEKYLVKLKKISNESKIDINEIAFKCVRDLDGITSLIIGIDNSEQLKENLEMINTKKLSKEIIDKIYHEFDNIPENIINPSKWGKLDVD